MGDFYASALGELEDQSLDYGFPSSVQMATPYSSSLGTIFSRHAAEIRSVAEPILQPLHQVSKRRIRDMIVRQNNELFQFMQHPERSPSNLGIAETIFRKYSHDVPVTSRFHAISRELNLDMSLNPVLQGIETSISGESFSLSKLSQQLKHVFVLYRQAGEEVVRLEAQLSQKADTLDKLQQRIPLLTTLTANEALDPLLVSFETYMKEVFVSARFEDTYQELVTAYKKWYLLREVVAFQQVASPTTTEPLCGICISEPVSHCVSPCGHTFCTSCVRRMTLTCYLCRGSVKDRIKLFLG